MTTRPARPSSSGSSIVIERSRKARIVAALVRRCSVTSLTVKALRPGAKAKGSRI